MLCGNIQCVFQDVSPRNNLDQTIIFHFPRRHPVSRGKLDQIISERTDSRKYEELKKEVSNKLQTNVLSNDKGQENYAGGYISQRLARLGKPLAPLAIAATMELIDRFSGISREDLGRIREMGECEAQSCFRLMKTLDRKIGVNSVLTSNPLERIPVYAGR